MNEEDYRKILNKTAEIVESGLEYALGEKIFFAEADLMDASNRLFIKELTGEQRDNLRRIIDPLKMELGY